MRKLFLLISLIVAAAMARAAESEILILPLPERVEAGQGEYVMKPGKIKVECPDELKNIPAMLGELLGASFDVSRVSKHADVKISLDPSVPAGAYNLDVTKKGVKISVSDYAGAAASMATLAQLLPPSCLDGATSAASLPCVSISDSPKYEWRGLLLDSSRHFWWVDEIKKQLRVMALFKLNKLHWHLTDSQEWRIPVDKYPQFGAGRWRPLDGYIDQGVIKRYNDTGNSDFLFPADRLKLTEPGDTVYGGEFSCIMRISEGGDTIYGGTYSREDIASVIAYADLLGIEVVPEVDMPGHFRGASKLLTWLSCNYEPFAALCPGRDSSLDFCKYVLGEVFEMFPSNRIHIGGDEVDKSHWRDCPDCKHRADSLGLKSTDELQSWFVREIADFCRQNGKEVIGWQEIADDGFKEGTSATIMWWLGEDPGVVKRAIAKGFDVVCCPRQNVYLDYEEDSKSLRKILDLRPKEYCGDAEALSHIKGMQGNMWTEWVPSIERLEYMVWPRLMAIGHMAWADSSLTTQDYYRLAAPQFKRLDAMKINYHLPSLEGFEPYNVFVTCDTLAIVNHLPGIAVHYTTDGTRPTLQSPLYQSPIPVEESACFQFGAFRPDGRCIEVNKAEYLKQSYSPAENANAASLNPGLRMRRYDFKGERCADIDSSALVSEEIVEAVAQPRGECGVIFDGFVDVSEDGVYTFFLTSDDGSILYIDGEALIDNDGVHQPVNIIRQKALARGPHKFELRYFNRGHEGFLNYKMYPSNPTSKGCGDMKWMH